MKNIIYREQKNSKNSIYLIENTVKTDTMIFFINYIYFIILII